MNLRKPGVWTGTDSLSAADAAAFAKRVESWGYGALWISEAIGREVFSAANWLPANTTDLVVASGIANIYCPTGDCSSSSRRALGIDLGREAGRSPCA